MAFGDSTILSLRGEAEVIHDLSNQKTFNGEIKSYGFPLKRVNFLFANAHHDSANAKSRNDEK